MIYKDFAGEKLSALGLGMMRLPVIDGADAAIDEAAAAEMVDYAYSHGINYYDTAWGYHGGQSELVTGKLLKKYPRESFNLASKFPGFDKKNFANVAKIFEKQLEKCQVDYFDFYLFHNVNEDNIDEYLDDEKYGTYTYLMEQKRNGRIRHLGFSAHGDMTVLRRFLEAYGKDMEFCQLQLNYMDWHYQGCDEKVALMEEWGIPVWVMEPVRGGRLAKASDEMLAEMRAMRPEESICGWAFRYLQSLPQVCVTLSGMSNMQQLKENIATYEEDKPLTAEESARLIARMDADVAASGLPCTACRYCTTYCPMSISIPEVISAYNEYTLTGSDWNIRGYIDSLSEGTHPASCVGCQSCEAVCPQHIGIAQVMKELEIFG